MSFSQTQPLFPVKKLDANEPMAYGAVGPRLLFCFLVCQPVECPKLWQAFFDTARLDGYQFDIVYHSCSKSGLGIDRGERKLAKVKTSWEQTIEAHYVFAKAADGYDKFIILSETCMPIKPPFAVWQTLNNHFTLLTGCQTTERAGGEKIMPKTWNVLMKHEQWCVIDKVHFACYTNPAPEIANFVSKIKVADNEFSAHALIRYSGGLDSVRDGLFWRVSWAPGVNPRFCVLDGAFQGDERAIRAHRFRARMKFVTNEQLMALSDSDFGLFARKYHESCQTAAQIALVSQRLASF